MKKIIAVLLIMVLICGSGNVFEINVAEAATEEEIYNIVGRNCPEILSETEIEHEINKGYVRKYCKFIPEKSDWYIYYSSSDLGVAGFIYNSDLSEMLIESDNYEYSDGYNVLTGDFKLKIYLEEGKTYYLGSHLYMGNKGVFKVGIKEVPTPTAISVTDSEVYEAGLGRREVLDVNFLPEDSEPEEVFWTSADSEIVEINASGECFYKNLGTTTVTATSKSGLTDTVTINVVVKDGIKEGETKLCGLGAVGTDTFVFLPEEDGRYRFVVKSDGYYFNVDTTITDKNNNDIGSISNGSITYADMYAGEHYYLNYSYTSNVGPNFGCLIPFCECLVERIGDIKDNSTEVNYDELWLEGEDISNKELIPIALNEEKTVKIIEKNAKSIHSFTAPEDGEYKFFAYGDHLVDLDIRNERTSNGEKYVTARLEAGKTYILTSSINSGSSYALGQYKIKIIKLPKSEKIQITNGNKVSGYIGESKELSIKNTPEECESEPLYWTSSDDNIVYVKDGTIYMLRAGKATITVRNGRGISDSIVVEVLHDSETAVDYESGDVNMDGIINSEDALDILKYSARLISFEEDRIGLADIDGNDKIDATDALEILKSAARINEK